MKHFVKIIALLVAASAVWIGLLKSSIVSGSIWLLPVYFVISLGCYGLLMVGVGLMVFPTCPHEAVLLQKDITEAVEFLKGKGVDGLRFKCRVRRRVNLSVTSMKSTVG